MSNSIEFSMFAGNIVIQLENRWFYDKHVFKKNRNFSETRVYLEYLNLKQFPLRAFYIFESKNGENILNSKSIEEVKIKSWSLGRDKN